MLTTRDIRVNGYPPLDEVLAHFDAIPVLIEACKLHSPETLEQWAGMLRESCIIARELQAVTKKAEKLLDLEFALG